MLVLWFLSINQLENYSANYKTTFSLIIENQPVIFAKQPVVYTSSL